MATITTTETAISMGSAGGLREDLEDMIWELYPDETYCLTNLDRVNATGVYHEWTMDALAAAAANIHIEGDDLASSASSYTAPTRAGNYCQIVRKDFTISGTLEEVKKAGRASEVARQAVKQMRELKNDLEYAIVRNQASSAGGSGTGRSMASMESWMATNEVLATTTSGSTTPGFSSGLVAAPTDGTTTGALTEGVFKTALQNAWTQGGDASVILTGTSQKAAIDAFAGIATKYNNVQGAKQATIIGAADVYVSDVGNHNIILHRHVRSTVVLAIDPQYWAVAFLRQPNMVTLAKTGDAERRMIVAEATLVSRNEKASAKVVSCS